MWEYSVFLSQGHLVSFPFYSISLSSFILPVSQHVHLDYYESDPSLNHIISASSISTVAILRYLFLHMMQRNSKWELYCSLLFSLSVLEVITSISNFVHSVSDLLFEYH